MPKNVAFLVRDAALAAIRDHAGVKASLDPAVQVFDRMPLDAPPLPFVQALRIPRLQKEAISTRLYQHTIDIVFQIVSDPYDDESPSGDALTEDVIEALETTFTLTGYGIPTEEQKVSEMDWDTIEGEQGEDLHINRVTLTVIALADE